jgi:transposase
MAGRRSKYTPETVERILQAIRIGSAKEHAAEYGGITKETFYQWLKSKSDFSDAVTRAEAEARTRWLAIVERNARGDDQTKQDWRAAAWMLERRYPQQYGKQAIEISGPDGGAIVVKGYANITPDDWQAPVERPGDSDV